ncbi:MAG: hypothetical protein H6Q74_1969 [Firmicutes bacterium]|nr:hypothetical protein [Bacillota bacterium]
MRVLLVFFVALAVFLPFNAQIVVTDPVEANYALTAKEMLMSGDWLSPRIYGQFWYDKPAMFYWLIMLCYKAFGVNEFAARFTSVLFSAASVSFVYWFGRRIFHSTRAALLAALVLGTSLEYWVLARMVITDAVLFFYFSVTLASLYLGVKGQRKRWFLLAYAFAGLAVLTKGPIGIVLPAIIFFIYVLVEQRWDLFGKLRLGSGLLIFFLIAVPWFWAMYNVHGQAFLDTFLGLHNYLRATVSEHPKDDVFYYYLVLFPVSILPWTGVLLHAFVGKKPADFTYLIVWLGVIIGFFTLMATKYPTYVFPAAFPAALLIGWKLDEMMTNTQTSWWWLSVPTLVLLAIFGVGANFLPADAWRLVIIVISIILALVILGLQLTKRGVWLPGITAALVVLLSLVIIDIGIIPLAGDHSAKTAVSLLPYKGATVAVYGDYTTSAVFYSGYSVMWLVDNAAELVPQDVWSSGKHIMPGETVASFNERTTNIPETYLLVNGPESSPLTGVSKIADFGKLKLYKRDL